MIRSKLIKLLLYFAGMFMPIVPALLWLGAFVAIDMFTGLWKAKHKKETWTSKRLGNSATKIVLYFLAIICAHVMDRELLIGIPLPFSIKQACVGFFSVIEFKSILENISSILNMPLDRYLRDKIDALRNK